MLRTTYHGNLRGASQPRSVVRLDGNEVRFDEWTVNLNSTHAADDFSVHLPFYIVNQADPGYLTNTPTSMSYLFSKSDVLVEILAGYEGEPLQRLMYGYMDTAEASGSSSGETVTITGRNMIALFLDNKTTEKYQNMTASAIAEKFAKDRGLKTDITPTYTFAGTYLNGDHVELNKNISEWDYLTFLAEKEGFELRVFDDTLYFGPFNDSVKSSQEAIPYTWGQNIESFTLSRSPHAAKDIIVDVHSYAKVKRSQHIVAQAKRSYTNSKSAYHERYYFPGLTQDQAQKRAESILNQLSMLEVTGTLNMAGNANLIIDQKIALYGVGTGLSEFYYVRKATHRFDTSSGYRTNVTFSNLLLPDENTGGI